MICLQRTPGSGLPPPQRHQRFPLRLSFVLPLLAILPGCGTEQSGLTSLMEACHPINATGQSIRTILTDAGWEPLAVRNSGSALGDLVGAQMWSFAAEQPVEAQLTQVDDIVFALKASLNDPQFGQLLGLVLDQIESQRLRIHNHKAVAAKRGIDTDFAKPRHLQRAVPIPGKRGQVLHMDPFGLAVFAIGAHLDQAAGRFQHHFGHGF